ncbi:Protein of unknown function [Micrococcales bacterium KH10]|nr:Protein of unknown function [Micrococcales bacterium KH10]
MEFTIGVQNNPREIVIESELSVDELTKQVQDALNSKEVLRFTDTKGRTVLVPATALAFIEAGSEEQRRVGFGAL